MDTVYLMRFTEESPGNRKPGAPIKVWGILPKVAEDS